MRDADDLHRVNALTLATDDVEGTREREWVGSGDEAGEVLVGTECWHPSFALADGDDLHGGV